MQPGMSPQDAHVSWAMGRGFADAATIKEAQRRLAALPQPDLVAFLVQGKAPPPGPTLLTVLEEMGRLTKEQREEGERESARQRSEFMNWRSQTMADEQAKRRSLPPPPG